MTERITSQIRIVDDDEAVRDSLAALLSTLGFAVRAFESGDAFLAAMSADCDCVLLDLNMPDQDGMAVPAALRERAITVPIVIVSGHAGLREERLALTAGASVIVHKPVGEQALLEALRLALGDDRL